MAKLKTGHPTSFTSVHVFEDKYTEFKQLSIPNGMSLQKLVNRAVHLYLTDASFRDRINNTRDLQCSGSSF